MFEKSFILAWVCLNILYKFDIPEDPLFKNKQNSNRIYKIFYFSNAIQMFNSKINTLELKIIKTNEIENKIKLLSTFDPKSLSNHIENKE